jgi:hypothetical protein
MRLFSLLSGLMLTLGIAGLGCEKKPPPPPPPSPPTQTTGPDAKPPVPPQPSLDLKPKGQIQPKEVAPAKKGLIQSIRGAATRPQRGNELKQIGLFMVQFVDDFKRKPKDDKEFVDYLGVQAAGIGKLITEGHYVLNHKVNVKDSTSVVAWEAVNDGGAFMTVRMDTSAALVPEAELEVLLGLRK